MQTLIPDHTEDVPVPPFLQLQQLRDALTRSPAGLEVLEGATRELQALEQALTECNARWLALFEVSTRLARYPDDQSLLKEIVRSSADLLRARGGGLISRDPQTGLLTIRVVYAEGHFVPQLTGRQLEPNQGLAGRVVTTGGPIVVNDYESWEGRVTGFERLHLKAVLAVPLHVERAVLGILMVTDRPAPFTEDDVQVLTLFAQQAAEVIGRTRARQKAAALAQSEERARVGRELHDGLAQNLATLLLKADLCRDLAAANEPALAEELDRLAEGLQRAVRETRESIFAYQELPSTGQRLVDGLGLVAARFEAQTRTAVALTLAGDPQTELPSGYHTALLRVAQEALTNVRKHARASEVTLMLDVSRLNLLELSVHDNGCGFDPGPADLPCDDHGFGLCSMRSRVEELGGDLHLASGAECGTTVTAILPLLRSRYAEHG